MMKMMMMMMMRILPIEVILVGIVTDVSPEHDWKAELPNNGIRVSIRLFY